MTNFVFMGECMVEFSSFEKGGEGRGSKNLYHKSIAGDVLNTAVYLKRLMANEVEVSMFTAVGDDDLSLNMINEFSKEALDTRFVKMITGKTPGAYLIELSEKGERNFVYWRDSSAAKFLFSNLANGKELNKLVEYCDVFYFSGISLAILQHKERFWTFLASLKDAGVQIVFDSNYRPVLWNNKENARTEFQQAFRYCDLIFAGTEDFEMLYGAGNKKEVLKRLNPMNIKEIIIKNGAKDIVYLHHEEEQVVKVQAEGKVKDTTAAGDSFNAGYLAKRFSKPLSNQLIHEAVLLGAKVAAKVIQYRGAIVNQDEFKAFTHSLG